MGSEFQGFDLAAKGYSKLANDWFDEICSQIDNVAEMKVVMYVFRHTVGFNKPQEYKHITVDDFMYGRMKADGTRMDRGTQMSEMSVRNGIKKAIEHGYIVCHVDNSDPARVKKSYRLNVREVQNLDPGNKSGVQNLGCEVKSLDPDERGRGKKFGPRTETNNSTGQSGKDNGSPPSPNKMGHIRRVMSEPLRILGNENNSTYRQRVHDIYIETGPMPIDDFQQIVIGVLNDTKLASGDIEYFISHLRSKCSGHREVETGR